MSFFDTFSEASHRIMQDEHRYISDIYVDLEFLQDIRFGALLLNLKTQDEVNYVYSQLDRYNDRLDERTTLYFPELGLDEKIIDETLSNKEDFIKVCCFAPMTSMYYNISSIISMVLRSNKYAEVQTPTVPQLWISVDNPNYPQQLLDALRIKLEEYFNRKIVVNVDHHARYMQNVGYYLSKQILFLYDFEQFVNRPHISNEFAAEGKFTDHWIFARPQINPRFASLKRKELLDGVDKMRDQLNIYCDFEYCPSQIVILNQNRKEENNG